MPGVTWSLTNAGMNITCEAKDKATQALMNVIIRDSPL